MSVAEIYEERAPRTRFNFHLEAATALLKSTKNERHFLLSDPPEDRRRHGKAVRRRQPVLSTSSNYPRALRQMSRLPES